MSDSAQGGNDILTGGDNSGSGVIMSNRLVGDASLMYDFARGGNDTLTGGDNSANNGSSVHQLFFSAMQRLMSDSARGGNDILTGGDNSGSIASLRKDLFGDASQMSDSAQGGNDILTGGEQYQRLHCQPPFRRCGSKCPVPPRAVTTS